LKYLFSICCYSLGLFLFGGTHTHTETHLHHHTHQKNYYNDSFLLLLVLGFRTFIRKRSRTLRKLIILKTKKLIKKKTKIIVKMGVGQGLLIVFIKIACTLFLTKKTNIMYFHQFEFFLFPFFPSNLKGFIKKIFD